ncbi:MAG TPA: hypothetical protein DCM07_32955 [Planctomycetaceae bacterium]|nr:hypothetical protein [Gimesia sp.]HAH49565.1 hypothetical protein [Planctomycetaceae bacterium]HBL45324.1 hypothetical protein [Planctomycetaceae bacterium]
MKNLIRNRGASRMKDTCACSRFSVSRRKQMFTKSTSEPVLASVKIVSDQTVSCQSGLVDDSSGRLKFCNQDQ